jgi:glycosyltransferase involved in cell wall biosynthesis
MLALCKALRQRGVRIVENAFHPEIDVYLLNSIHFDVESFLSLSQKQKLPMVHRVDGPIYLIRGRDRDLDEMIFEINAQFADYTIVQSTWTYERIIEMGYKPVNPVIVHNGVDPDIFESTGRISFDRERKVRLISSSWSENPRKGGPIYKWIEEHLDWDRFEYTFVGRASEPFARIHQIAPVPSERLADLLREHDIYITASANDPCSNALIEALACGLPALYLDDGGHPELVGYGGLGFKDVDDILSQLDALVENYALFQSLIQISSMEAVAEKYLKLLRRAKDIAASM